MPSDLTDLLEAADVPPMSVDPSAVLAGGKRRRRHRRLAGSVATLAVAVVLVLAGAAVGWHPGAAQVVPTPAVAVSPSPVVTPKVPVTARVALDVGHCWIEYVEFDGRLWGLPFARQIGSGGGLPRSWKGTGAMERLSTDRSRYTDDGGAVLEMVPARGASVYEDEGRVCI